MSHSNPLLAHLILVNANNQQLPVTEFLNLGKDARFPGPSEDRNISDRHCRIEMKPEGFLIRDLRSTTGTYLNGVKVNEAWLQDGDEIRLGGDLAIFSLQRPEISLTDKFLNSKNDVWKSQLARLPSIARSPYPVLLLGSSGTGKEGLAQKIHEYSGRGPFVSVNCSALTETLVESELFGHVKGSFTGAISDRKGAFESARGGTLFLDEVGDLTYGLQAKLLRALENNEIRPVGSDRNIQTDVRILAATHQNLSEQINEGKFRRDLYFRLNVVSLTPPLLADRMEDFDDLIYSFARQMKVRFSFGAIQKLKKHKWPGNIRELKNTVARASAFFPKMLIEESHIDEIVDGIDGGKTYIQGVGLQSTSASELPVIKEIEKQMIIKRLIANNGNQRRTAADLGMPKSTLHDRIRTYQIDQRVLHPKGSFFQESIIAKAPENLEERTLN